jgi:hypothetical protein
MGERLLYTPEVVGSIPTPPTTSLPLCPVWPDSIRIGASNDVAEVPNSNLN